LFVGGPWDGKVIPVEGRHVWVGSVIGVTCTAREEAEYVMETWGVFEVRN
jgi:hypothetical protein